MTSYPKSEMRTAILIDGGFYQRRAHTLWGPKSPAERADELISYCYKHLNCEAYENRFLYRIFYYDCPPSDKEIYHPLTKKQIKLGESTLYKWMNEFHDVLRTRRKVALRFGKLSEIDVQYTLHFKTIRKLCSGSLSISDLTENDFILNVTQKGVDTRIGLDVASMSLKKQVTQIILISGDSDFVPIAKFARREGIDFILDPMWSNIRPDLNEHIDGLYTPFPRPHETKRSHEQ